MNLSILAGAISTSLFGASMLPMVLKAIRTRDLTSYSLGNLAINNLANVIHSVYVFSLPFGPIWLLHSFYLVTESLMLVYYLRFTTRPAIARTRTITRERMAEQEAAA